MRYEGTMERIRGAFVAVVLFAVILGVGPPAATGANSPAAPESYTEAMFYLAHPSGLQKFVKSVTSPNSTKYFTASSRIVSRVFGAYLTP